MRKCAMQMKTYVNPIDNKKHYVTAT